MVETITPTIVKIDLSGQLKIGQTLNRAVFGGVIDWWHTTYLYNMPTYYWYFIIGFFGLLLFWWFIKNFII